MTGIKNMKKGNTFDNIQVSAFLHVSDFVDIHVSVHDCINGQCRYAFEAEFVHDILAVGDHCGQTDVETVGYFFVDETADDERHHFFFSFGETLFGVGIGRAAVRQRGRQVATVGMCALYESEERPYQLFFRYIDAKTVKIFWS